MASENRRQHYVPQFYLSYFTDYSRYLWVYDVGRPPRRSLPDEIAHQRDYYALEAEGQSGYSDSQFVRIRPEWLV
jgi:hypothetical protein